ncbi:GDSL-type esterase/lipase family protein [Oleispirillum naphthae]|uniref:GDSL-type esterase/lipase family protein n=1 Tax=Oleispirillum naphthae TaxID=2838853 RepID=UPI00308237BE
MPPRDLRLIFFGDSLVNGACDPEMLGWCGRLARLTAARTPEATYYNLGVRHQTSRELLARFRAELGIRLAGDFEKRAVISIGFNDTVLEDGIPRVPPADSRAALAEMLAAAAEFGCPVLVVSPPTSTEAAQAARIRALAEAQAEICAARGVPFIPGHALTAASPAWLREAAENDGYHPRAAAYAALAEAVFRTPEWTRFTA